MPVIAASAALWRSGEGLLFIVIIIVLEAHLYYYCYPLIRTWAMGRALGPADDTPATAVTIVTI